MIIQSSAVGMAAKRTYSSSYSSSIGYHIQSVKVAAAPAAQVSKSNTSALPDNETIDRQTQDKTAAAKSDSAKADSAREKKENSSFSDILEDEAAESMTNSMLGIRSSRTSLIQTTSYREAMEDIRRKCMDYLMKIFYGGSSTQYKNYIDDMDSKSLASETLHSGLDSTATGDSLFQVFSIAKTQESIYTETEKTTFSTEGTVVNADGKEIKFNLSLDMSRSYCQSVKSTTYQTEISLVDPLVINLDTNIAGLSDQKFSFDIDNNGVMDTISQLNSGSGYLAMDRDGNGKIDHGGELFGTKTGDGFGELSEYDSDGNGWIDEADDIWKKLLIWTKDESGNDKLYTLKEAGVGAICLQNVETNFSLNSLRDNTVNGVVRSTGMFLYENGTAGSIQHIDVAS